MLTTIKNCWLKANILPKDNENESKNEIDINDPNIQVYLIHIKKLEELIDVLDFENSFTANKYVQYNRDEITTEILSNEEILKAILPNNQEKEIKEPLDALPSIIHSEAIELYNKALRQCFIFTWQINIDSFYE
ncbi:hypothetical protein C1645_837941 [Glomus cerebriforme]|uniref:Uncharacterized protein n=1 Tax=Glomus cerebriforme TaxID=658196 RepID=A0A397S370_9GLOM|nr:hypothetical protein C1645_837941 [Glomus cerebriforme]